MTKHEFVMWAIFVVGTSWTVLGFILAILEARKEKKIAKKKAMIESRKNCIDRNRKATFNTLESL